MLHVCKYINLVNTVLYPQQTNTTAKTTMNGVEVTVDNPSYKPETGDIFV